MTEHDSFANGTPSWVDLGAPDPDAAAAFYGALFGWDVAAPTGDDDETGAYRMCTLKGRPVAGIGPSQVADAPPWWTTYVTVADADATAKAVEEAGGATLVEPSDVADLGRMAAFTDPLGAAFSVWQPKQHHGAGLVNEHGALTWNELTVRDVEPAVPFYGAVFGWTAEQNDMGGGMRYTTFKRADDDRAIAGATPMAGDVPAHWVVYFAVDDCDATSAKATELGARQVSPSMDIPDVGRFAILTGPQGEVFAIIQNASTD